MRCSRKMIAAAGSTLGITALVLVATGWIMPGGAIAGERVLPAQLESRIASDGTADDHLAAALLYQKEGQRAQAEVNKYIHTGSRLDQAHRRSERVPAKRADDGGADASEVCGRDAATLCGASNQGRDHDG